MTATYTPSLGLALPADGDTGWGSTINSGTTSLIDSAIAGYTSITMTTADFTLSTTDGAANQARSMLLNIAGAPGTARNVICPAKSKLYFVRNVTTGGFAVTVKTPSGTGISIPNGKSMVLMCDGTDVREAVDYFNSLNTSAIGATTPGTGAFTSLAYSTTLTGGTGIVNLGSGQFYKDASGNVGVGTTTPTVKLDVIGAGNGGLQYRTGTRTVGIGQTASEASVYWGSTTPLTFFSGSERMRIDASGNLGIGGTPTSKLHVFGTFRQNDATNSYGYTATTASNKNTFAAIAGGGYFVWQVDNSGVDSLTLDASGNVRIGTTTALAGAGEKLSVNVNSTGFAQFMVQNNNSGYVLGLLGQNNLVMYPTAGGPAIGTISNDGTNVTFDGTTSLRLSTANVERMRIDSSGNVLVGRTAAVSSERFCVEQDLNAAFIVRVRATNSTSPFGQFVSYPAAAPNGTSNQFLRCDDNAATRAEIRSNGGLANYSANNANLSDVRTKKDITDAPSYLARICAIPVRTFLYKDQTDGLINLGVIAQEVETQCPELVDTTGFGETPDDGVPLKAIYQTDLQYALMKCIQEQQALITDLRARVAALEKQ